MSTTRIMSTVGEDSATVGRTTTIRTYFYMYFYKTKMGLHVNKTQGPYIRTGLVSAPWELCRGYSQWLNW
jgi:hypothetical protein